VRERILAYEGGRGDLVDRRRDDLLLGDRGEPVTDEPGVGLDLGEADRERSFLVEPEHTDADRDVERSRLDAGDLHGGMVTRPGRPV
jgi:hypothetical protein